MICAYCGKEFQGRRRKFCCKECCLLFHGQNPFYKPETHCLICGRELTKGQKKYCSSQCCGKAYAYRKGGKPMEQHLESIKRKPRVCRYCGKPFIKKSRGGKVTAGSGTFCSRKCWGAWRTAHKKEKSSYKIGAKNKVYFKRCDVCGIIFTARQKTSRFCSDQCRYEKFKMNQRGKYIPKPKIAKRCKVCGNTFKSNRLHEQCCSLKCKKINKRLSRGHNHRQRARYFGVEYEYVNVLKVFNRDGWRCQICGKVTPRKNRGKRYSNAPELDHRIPMLKGGGHLYSNVQCACRACNAKKSNLNGDGQLPLFEIESKRTPGV
jgi:predicted nucleic acid-binding Zn ribbon protein